MHQGEPGDRFYLVREGQVEVISDGVLIGKFGPTYYFGEIALLRDVPRVATVTPVTDTELYAIGRDDFLATVTGHAESARTADAVVAERLRSLRPSIAVL